MPGQDSGYIGNLTKGGIFTTAPRGGLLLLEGRTPIHRVMRKARNSSRRVDLYSQRIMSKPPVVSFCVACVHCLPRLAVSIRIAHVSFVVQLSVLLREAPVPARITYLVATRYRHRAVAIRIPFVQCPVLPVCVGVARVCFSRSGCVAEQGNRNPPVSARGGRGLRRIDSFNFYFSTARARRTAAHSGSGSLARSCFSAAGAASGPSQDSARINLPAGRLPSNSCQCLPCLAHRYLRQTQLVMTARDRSP